MVKGAVVRKIGENYNFSVFSEYCRFLVFFFLTIVDCLFHLSHTRMERCLKKYCDCFNSDLKCDPSKCRCTDCQNSPFDDDLEGDESSVSVACDKEQSEYDEGEDSMDDIQTPFKQEEDYQADFGFVASSSSISLLDDKAPIFQDDGVAV